jgi:threonine aldolase
MTAFKSMSRATAVAVICLPSNFPGSRRVAKGRALFNKINLKADGLGLEPAEYVAELGKLIANQPLIADTYSAGGAVAELEQKFAQALGKERALFMPTGTLANHVAVRTLAGANNRVLVQMESHLYNDTSDCAEQLSGLKLIPLAPGKATFELAEVQHWVERSAAGPITTRIGAIAIESPVRRSDQAMFDFAEVRKISAYAREQGIRLHLDGARMFNLPTHSGKSIGQYTALFDTVYVSIYKHFNGASGAILAGDAAAIEDMARTRKIFGGALPHAWPNIALAANYLERYQTDYARAWQVAEDFIVLLRKDSRFHLEKIANGTSRFLMAAAGVAPELFAARLLERGVILPPPRTVNGAAEFPLQVNGTLLRTTAPALMNLFTESLGP